MPHEREAVIRHRLWVTKLARYLARRQLEAETNHSRDLHRQMHEEIHRAERLQRRARWLVRTGKPLPSVRG